MNTKNFLYDVIKKTTEKNIIWAFGQGVFSTKYKVQFDKKKGTFHNTGDEVDIKLTLNTEGMTLHVTLSYKSYEHIFDLPGMPSSSIAYLVVKLYDTIRDRQISEDIAKFLNDAGYVNEKLS